MDVAPLQGVEYSIEAVLPSKAIADMLQMPQKEACLVLHRKPYRRAKSPALQRCGIRVCAISLPAVLKPDLKIATRTTCDFQIRYNALF